MPKASTFQQWLFQMRTMRGFSQKDLAEAATQADPKSGIWQPRISEWENGDLNKKPSLKQLFVLFSALRCSLKRQREGRALWESLVLQDDDTLDHGSPQSSEPDTSPLVEERTPTPAAGAA